jgi:hypothetical protein
LVRYESGEGSDRGEVGEPGGVTEPADDLWCADASHAGNRADDRVGIDLLVEFGDPSIQGLDLVADGQRQTGLSGDVGSERVEVHAVITPQP